MVKKQNGDAALERIKVLKSEMDSLKSDARDEALAQIQDAIDTLSELGFSYRLVQGTERRSRASSAREGSTRQRDPEKPCPICNFVTDPPHDARRHRSQGDNKKPFNADQLSGFGLTRVG